MLLEFRLKNYRSFSEEAALSLVASGDSTLKENNAAPTGIPSIPSVLRSAVIYGANASGKSNLIRGLNLMKGVVVESASLQPGQTFNVQPFQLDRLKKTQPTLFEVTLAIDRVRYQYGFQFTPARIVGEWLLVYKTKRPQRWFSREYNAETDQDSYEFSSFFSGQKDSWKKATRSNALFLSMAVQLNCKQLEPLFKWFARDLVVFPDEGFPHFGFTTNAIQSEGGQGDVKAFLSSADMAISSIKAVRKEGFHGQLQFSPQDGFTSKGGKAEIVIPVFKHEAGKNQAEFELHDESRGTQKMFCLAAPMLDILKNGRTLVVDELDGSLHPLLIRQILNTFHDPERNGPIGQIVFATHDTSLMLPSLMRRDQIWLTEKSESQSSELIPLSDFTPRPRKNEAIGKGYLAGKYGSIPIVGHRLDFGGFGG